ncbi:MAG: acyl-CoA synthetase [Gammaproteobacteria bacterium]
MTPNKYDTDLNPCAANHVPLSPLSLLRRAAAVYPDKIAVIHGAARYSYRQFEQRCRRLASALQRRGVGRGDTVAVIAPNVPALLEAHYGVPMLGAVLNALNYRLDAATIRFILEHGEARVLLTDREFSATVKQALAGMSQPPLVIDIDDPLYEGGTLLGELDYEALLQEGAADFMVEPPDDEWQAIALNYTSGTTGDPKGVVYHHRGAYLNALGNVLALGLNDRSVYLWTLPMFHCNGWTYTWGVTAAGGTHVCLRRIDPALIFPLLKQERVTHLCGAPIILNMLVHAPDEIKCRFEQTITVGTGGAAPPSQVIANMEALGFHVIHLYGLTECYGPATICVEQPDWHELDLPARAAKMARQGVRYTTSEDIIVADPETLQSVPADGATLGEIMLRGNTVMKGYLKNPAATAKAFQGGWYHTGDLAVMHPDGYLEVKDRSKDIIISGGENISSLEVEETLYKHPAVMDAAVVARPDERWGEAPCAFVTLKTGATDIEAETIIQWCRDHLAHFKVPKTIVFGPLPKTSTGKIQKFVLREQAKALADQ